MYRHHPPQHLPIRARRFIPAAIAVAAALSPSAQAADGQFSGGTDLSAPAPVALATGDFNNDGRTDLAAVVKNGTQIYLQTPEGVMEAKGNPIQTGMLPFRVVAGDFDHDGNDDLAVADAGLSQLNIRIGGGNGVFVNGEDIDLGLGYHAENLAIGDFNGDTYEDLAVPATFSSGGSLTRIYTGRFGGAWDAQPADLGHVAALIGTHADREDDADTFDDLVTATDNAAELRVRPAVGGGAFEGGPKYSLDTVIAGPNALASGDFDGDGRVDVATVTKTGVVSVRRGRGDGGFEGAVKVLGGVASRQALAVADFDGDGHEDLAVSDDAGDGVVHVLLGDGKLGFAPAPDVKVGKAPAAIAVGDFDDDGVQDIATANPGSDSISIRPGTSLAPLASNLLVNGGFEGPTPSGRIQSLGINGWELQGESSWVKYGAPSHSYTPTAGDSARYGGGRRMFWGGRSSGTDGITGISQSVDVSPHNGEIDAGRTTARLSAYLGGALLYDDAMQARADFLDGAGVAHGAIELGPVTAADRHHSTTLLRRAGTAAVPPGTRRIRVTLKSVDTDKAFSSAIADNVKLTLSVAPPPGTGTPDPGTGGGPLPSAGVFGADPFVRFSAVSRRLRKGAPLSVRARNGNPFAVTGQVRVKGSRRTQPLQLAADGAATVRLALPARVRKALARRHRARVTISAVVVDAAGNARTVTRRVVVKRKVTR